MKAASGIAYVAASLLVACATAQSVDGTDAIGGVADGGHQRDSGTMPPGDGGSTDTGGSSSTSTGGSATGSSGGAGGSDVNASGGSGGSNAGGTVSGGAAGRTTTGGTGGTLGAAGNGGSTQAAGGSTQGGGGSCTADQKMCGGACVTQLPSNGCSATSCTACPIPAPQNGIQICDPQGQCNFECLSGYQKNGTLCTMGGGGGAGSGGASSGGAPAMCGNDSCHRCLGNLVGCCNKQGDHCLCVFPNQTDQCGP